MMDKTQESLIRGFDNGDYTVARVFPNGSNYKSVEKKHKTTLSILTKVPLPTTFPSTLTVKHEITKKTTDAQRLQPRKSNLK